MKTVFRICKLKAKRRSFVLSVPQLVSLACRKGPNHGVRAVGPNSCLFKKLVAQFSFSFTFFSSTHLLRNIHIVFCFSSLWSAFLSLFRTHRITVSASNGLYTYYNFPHLTMWADNNKGVISIISPEQYPIAGLGDWNKNLITISFDLVHDFDFTICIFPFGAIKSHLCLLKIT